MRAAGGALELRSASFSAEVDAWLPTPQVQGGCASGWWDVNVTSTAGHGTCNMIALDADGNPTTMIKLRDCAYVPDFGVNLLSVQLLKSRGAHVDVDAGTITFSSGAVAHFDDDFTMSVVPTPNGAYPAIISRGKRGPTKISTRELTPKQQMEMELWQNRLNGATAKTP